MSVPKILAALVSGIFALCLMACADNNETALVQNVTDELLVCDLQEFSDSMGGRLLSDWRKPGSDGIEVTAVEGGLDVRYSFTRETGDRDLLDRLKFAKTVTVDLSSEEVLGVKITEAYNASSKRIGPRRTNYSVAERIADADDASDAGYGPFSYIDEDDAIELMNEYGCLQLVNQASTSPIEFFVSAYFEYDANTPYSEENWGHYADKLG